MSIERHCDVAIIGAGIVGCAIAHELCRYLLDVVLIEREAEVGFGTTKANSGIIHGGFHSSPAKLKGQLEWAGNKRWDALCEELGFGFARVGELTVALDESDLPALDLLEENAATQGVPGVERWTGERARRAEPNLTAEVVAALHGTTTGVVNPYEVCFGLAESAIANGLELLTDSPVTELRTNGDTWTVETPSHALDARFVINAAGLYADAIAAMAGLDHFAITARKGEEYLLDKRLIGLVRKVIYPCPEPDTKGTLVIPTYDGTIMIGPTATVVDDRSDLGTTAAGAEQVLAAAKRLVPVIDEADIIAEFAGSRAILASEDFLIGPTEAPGFVNVAGIQSPGLTAAPAIATLVVDILEGEGLELVPETEPSPLERPIHFASLPTAEQQSLAAVDHRYRRIVCRCEFITEGEIGDAIEHGARTLDGVKFRTRAGMGRCQGGFCTARCIELLGRDLDVPVSAVTKRGGDSWLVLDRPDEVADPPVIDDRPFVLHDRYDVVVAGAGPAGLGAAIAAREAGAERVLVVDREAEAGGILLQCIHSGFGLHHFGEELTGPEYAQRVLEHALDDGVDVLTDAYVLDIAADRQIKLLSGRHGVSLIDSGATVLAMGARERTRQAIRIPGSRPAGVFTAGAAQRLVNLHGVLPGRRVAILGSGDIGLIMARRLVLEGIDVAGVFELMPHANGLSRNIVQCLHDFDIPLHLSTTVTEIHGRDRVDGVTVAPVDEHLQPIADKSWHVPCDTLLVSIGLIPENELSRQLRLRLDPTTAGPVVTSSMETSRDGVFACGNVVHIHDLVDFVSAESALAGRFAGLHATGRQEPIDNVRLLPSTNVGYCVPHTISTDRQHTVYLRVRRPLEKSVLRLRNLDGDVIHERKLRYVVPAEMVTLRLRPAILEGLHGDALRVEVEPR